MIKFAKKFLNGLLEFIGRTSTRVFATIFAILWLSMGAYVASNNWTSVNTWESGIGKVVGHKSTSSMRSGKTKSSRSCVAVIEFQKRDGSTHQFKSRMGSEPCPYKIGEDHPILYSGSKPNTGVIHSYREIWLAPTVSFSIAAAFAFIGIFGKKIRDFNKSLKGPSSSPATS